ncbi:hypothetical protein DOT_1940 [Desulfosporosinus sp. OT]|nr:hypothetical protein DOT_1940 [Desulfosporosinus sp. OT]
MTDGDVFGMLKSIFPERLLYRMSTDWREDKKFILKAKGTMGDVLVGWTENQRIGQNPVRHCPLL